MKINSHMKITEIVRKWPEVAVILTKYKMGCIECLLGDSETLENGAKMHGLDVNALLSEINELITANYNKTQ